MKKILIISDTHGQHRGFEEILDKEQPIDLLIHMGDVEGDEDLIRAEADCPCQMVAGNNDFFSFLDREREFDIGKYRVFITHGHQYMVSLGTERLREEARQREADIVMFGHTHRPYLDQDDEMIVLNPGSVSYPRQEGRKPSYIIMELGLDGKPQFEIKYL